MRHVILIIILISLLFVLFGKVIIQIVYGPSFLPSYDPMIILLFFVFLRTIDQIISSYVTYIKHFWTLSFASTMFIGLVLAILLIQDFGMLGAAIASVGGQFAATIIVSYSFINNIHYYIFSNVCLNFRNNIGISII